MSCCNDTYWYKFNNCVLLSGLVNNSILLLGLMSNIPVEIWCHILSNNDAAYVPIFGLTCWYFYEIAQILYERTTKASKQKTYIQNGHLNIVKYIAKYYKLSNKAPVYAARFGQFQILKYVLSSLRCKITAKMYNVVALGGHTIIVSGMQTRVHMLP